MTLGLIFIAAVGLTSAALPFVRHLALAVGAIDRPGARRLHRAETPRLGGVAVFIGIYASLALAAGGWGESTHPLGSPHAALAFVTAAGFWLVGLVDDLHGLRAKTKLALECLLAASLYVAGVQIEAVAIPGAGSVQLPGIVAFACTTLWLAGVANAFNLIDGVNGLAGGVALVAGLSCLALGIALGSAAGGVIGAAVTGAVIAFLPVNLRLGGVFLGDSGSLLLGSLLAAGMILLWSPDGRAELPSGAILVLGLPLTELVTTVLRRTLRAAPWSTSTAGWRAFLRRGLFEADAEHLHHTLLRAGLAPSAVAGTLVAAAAIFALLGIAVLLNPAVARIAWWAAGMLSVACAALGVYGERYLSSAPPPFLDWQLSEAELDHAMGIGGGVWDWGGDAWPQRAEPLEPTADAGDDQELPMAA